MQEKSSKNCVRQKNFFILPHIFCPFSVIQSEGRERMAFRLEEEYDRLYRYCYYRVKDRYLAEDLTQEAFLRYLDREPEIPREAACPICTL